MSVNWMVVFNRMFRMIDGEKSQGNGMYYSGPRFIEKIQELRPDTLDYGDFISEREHAGQSTTRRYYFEDLFMELDEAQRYRFVSEIESEGKVHDPAGWDEVRTLMGGGALAPSASIPREAWNADRLNEYLKKMDEALSKRDYAHTVTLAYTCLEGFFKAFVRKNIPREKYEDEITALAKEIKGYLKAKTGEYPDEVLNLLTQSAHALNRTRDRFSESHFGGETDEWLATYMRDLVNTQIRLLLHFM
jgi:HEPN domain-containing protein